MEITLCDRFPALTPFNIRREKMVDLFKLINRMNIYAKHAEKRKDKQDKPKIIRRPAGDDWF